MVPGMDAVILPPELEEFAAEAVASGRYRDVSEVIQAGVTLLRRMDAARAEPLASVVAAEAGGDRDGYLSIDQVEAEMQAAIRSAALPRG
jgi:putative addiction module CopG family antidote